ncbi:MAG: dihydroorotase [Clostridiaceae bacterium]|jgi:dihydroorotase|nr:dihydroorotase [Clostridiaceae bacterium]
MRLLIKHCSIVDAESNYEGFNDVYIADGVIKLIEPAIELEADRVIDAAGFYLLPGFIDMHTHLREPGFEYKETVYSGTRAAAKGGYTTVCCMPNTKPVIDDEASLSRLLDIVKKDAAVKVHPIAAVSLGQKGTELTEMKKLREMGAVAFSDDGKPVMTAALMMEALLAAKANNFLIIDHCEELSLAAGGAINQGKKAEQLGIRGIHPLSEELYVMRDVMIAEAADSYVHIAHISTAGSAKIIREAKARGVRVTCEVMPHHIGLTEDIITQGFTDCKVNPPLRTAGDAEALKEALRDGTIDVIATDHAPHHKDEKGEDFYSSAFGISGIETAFSVCYTELVKTGILTLKDLSAKMSGNPAKLLKLETGIIRSGSAADLVIVDTARKITVDRESLVSKGKNTPFHGRTYTGGVVYTIVDGNIAYEN